MKEKEFLTENEVKDGTRNYLLNKGRTAKKRVLDESDAEKKQHGVDLRIRLENEAGNGNTYLIEVKGNLRSDRMPMKSSFRTNFRWAISQIILRIRVDSTKYNYNYGIAVPDCEIENCIALIHNNWALRDLKIRLYGAFRENGQLTAREYTPSKIYDPAPRRARGKRTSARQNPSA